MARSNKIEAGAKIIAEDFHLPGGGLKKLARLVEDHLDWFDKAETGGLTWADMSRLLFAAGAKGRNGRPFSVGTLYSTVWRKREDAKRRSIASPSKSVTEIRAATLVLSSRNGRSDVAPKWKGKVDSPRKPRQVQRLILAEPEYRSKKVETAQVEISTGRQLSPTKSEKALRRPSSNKDLLAFMQRSAAVRGFESKK